MKNYSICYTIKDYSRKKSLRKFGKCKKKSINGWLTMIIEQIIQIESLNDLLRRINADLGRKCSIMTK